MTTEEVRKALLLLSSYFPNAKQLKDENVILAWKLALERFLYDDVREAIIQYAIKKKYFPDVADITGRLRPEASYTLGKEELEAIKRLMEGT